MERCAELVICTIQCVPLLYTCIYRQVDTMHYSQAGIGISRIYYEVYFYGISEFFALTSWWKQIV
jgi:hypothetical protein